ncbi:MAG TPA: gliding motility lipoprotein GldH [Chitinophagaceae bacterium]
MKNFLLVIVSSIFFISCAKIGVFEKTAQIPSQSWFYDNKPSFTFTITDTSASYNIYIVLRHTDAYTYNNLWLAVSSQAPGDTIRSQNINLELGNDTKGWEGTGMDDIFEIRKNITPGPLPFKKAGNYTFTIAQIMRENPLMHILNVGIRVEKVNL